MDKNNKNKKIKNLRSFGSSASGRRISADRNIVSDVLGSYTGTPINRGFQEDNPDFYPVQDADDL